MAKVITEAMRFSYPEWKIASKKNFKNAELERRFAERLVAESKRLIDDTDERMITGTEDTDKKLEQRVSDISFWKGELDKKVEDVTEEIAATEAAENKIADALEKMSTNALHINRNNILNREKRHGIELVHDEVQMELLKEQDVINGVQEMLAKTLDELKEQNRLNRRTKFYLEKDLKDKFSAKNIDEHTRELNVLSSGLGMDNCCETTVNANSLNVDEWEKLTDDIINNAEAQRQNSIKLRSFVDTLLQQAHCDLVRQKERVDSAFEKRIRETKETKAKLEDHLNQVLTQIREMEENVDRLEKSICEKEPALKLACTRLTHRQQRPNNELCRDPAQFKMIAEVSDLQESLEKLRAAMATTKDSIKGLRRRKLELEEDIDNKAHTIFIDDVENMGMRRSLVYQSW